MKRIKTYLKFINESRGFDIDYRFPWAEELEGMADSIIERIDGIVDEYNYGTHRRDCTDGFEFDIKARTGIDAEGLAKKYNISEDSIYDYYNQFLSDNLESAANDIIGESGFFSNWCVAGRSGGWLVLEARTDLVDDPKDTIDSRLLELEYYTKGIDDELVNKWKVFKEKAGKGYGFLKMTGVEFEDFSDIEEAEGEANDTKESFENTLKQIDDLEKDLLKVQKRIDDFWDSSEDRFDDYLKSVTDF